MNAAYHHYILEGHKKFQMSDAGVSRRTSFIENGHVAQAYLLHPSKKLICSCVVPLGFCEQLAQALDRKWNSKIEKKRKNNNRLSK